MSNFVSGEAARVGVWFLAMISLAFAQPPRRFRGSPSRMDSMQVAEPKSDLDQTSFSPDRFTFVRVVYDSQGGPGEAYYPGDGEWRPRWATDHPDGAKNLTWRLNQLTTIRANQGSLLLRLTDPQLQDFPFVFMSDPGWQVLSEAEQKALRQYLANGGFLWIDDFWGEAEWKNLEDNLKQVAPSWKWFNITADHPIMSNVYPLSECPQIPALQLYRRGGDTYDPPWIHKQPNGGIPDVSKVNFRGLNDDSGRLVAVATHNTDIADGWEREGDDEEFFQRFSVKAYALAINILTYAMSN
ncbi:MAG: DUF4159 domain-containing protein [Pirellula sp.]|nr:DUF4159 domain-containing protein [Pirellula sp.]